VFITFDLISLVRTLRRVMMCLCPGFSKNIWWPVPLFFVFYFTDRIETSTMIYSNLAWGLHGVVWT
jgi:hypothetical protein